MRPLRTGRAPFVLHEGQVLFLFFFPFFLPVVCVCATIWVMTDPFLRFLATAFWVVGLFRLFHQGTCSSALFQFFLPCSPLPSSSIYFNNSKNDPIISSSTSNSTNLFLWVWPCHLIPSARGFLIIFLCPPSAFGVQLFNRLFCLATSPSLGYLYNPYPS